MPTDCARPTWRRRWPCCSPCFRDRPLAGALALALLVAVALFAQFEAGRALLAVHRLATADPTLGGAPRSALAFRSEEPARSLRTLLAIQEAATRIDALVPPSHCVHTLLPDWVALHITRPVFDLPADFDWRRVGCGYLFAVSLRAPGRTEAPMYPADGRALAFELQLAKAGPERRIVAALLQRPTPSPAER